MAEPLAKLKMITLDSADAQRDGAFWAAVLGWETTYAEGDYAMLAGPEHALGFGTVPDFAPPPWPNEHGSKQFHFDLAVDDLAATAAQLVELGATEPADQPGGDRWRVLLDPSGHPFCLTLAGNWS